MEVITFHSNRYRSRRRNYIGNFEAIGLKKLLDDDIAVEGRAGRWSASRCCRRRRHSSTWWDRYAGAESWTLPALRMRRMRLLTRCSDERLYDRGVGGERVADQRRACRRCILLRRAMRDRGLTPGENQAGNRYRAPIGRCRSVAYCSR